MKILENKLSININNNHRLYLTVHCLHTITNSYYKTKHFSIGRVLSTFQVRLDFKFYILFLFPCRTPDSRVATRRLENDPIC